MTSLALDVGTSELTGLRLHARHPLTRQFYLTAYPLLMTVSFQGFTQLGKACTEESLLCYYSTWHPDGIFNLHIYFRGNTAASS